MWTTWRQAMRSALYGPAGFYARGEAASGHFRTSVGASPRFACALFTVLRQVDAALGHPARVELVDIGAGRGELLSQLLAAAAADPSLAARIAPTAVEVAPAPDGLDPRIAWQATPPRHVEGLVIANEWLDNIPLDVVERGRDGTRLVLVDPASGAERPGPPPSAADLRWLRVWWPLRSAGERAEIGRPRCQAWSRVVGNLRRGLALAVDYSHERADRPPHGTLSAYQHGLPVRVIPDGSRDITAHVALDACAKAGQHAGARATVLTTQREALRALGVTGRRPRPAIAVGDPAGYARALQVAAEEAVLLDPAGLGGFGWLAQTAGPQGSAALAALGWLPARGATAAAGAPMLR